LSIGSLLICVIPLGPALQSKLQGCCDGPKAEILIARRQNRLDHLQLAEPWDTLHFPWVRIVIPVTAPETSISP